MVLDSTLFVDPTVNKSLFSFGNNVLPCWYFRVSPSKTPVRPRAPRPMMN